MTDLKESLWVEQERGQDQLLLAPGRNPGQSSVCEGSPESHGDAGSLIPQAQRETAEMDPESSASEAPGPWLPDLSELRLLKI